MTKAAATVTLSDLSQTYDGNPSPASASAKDSANNALGGVTIGITYDGSTTAPTNAGSYAVVATIDDTNYSGTASGTLVVQKAAATVTLGSLSQTYTGSALAATATTNPAGLDVTFSYSADPVNAGTYTATGTINNTNYAGTASDTLTINKAALTATLGSLSEKYGADAPTNTEWAATLTYSAFAGSDTSSVVDTSSLAVTYNAVVGNVGKLYCDSSWFDGE